MWSLSNLWQKLCSIQTVSQETYINVRPSQIVELTTRNYDVRLILLHHASGNKSRLKFKEKHGFVRGLSLFPRFLD